MTIEDWGVGMTPVELAEANEILRHPREVDLSVSQRLGLHVVARLAQRYGIGVELTGTPGGGVTAVATLPPSVFARSAELVGAAAGRAGGADGGLRPDLQDAAAAGYDHTAGPSTTPHLNGIGTDVGRSTPFDGSRPTPFDGSRPTPFDGSRPTPFDGSPNGGPRPTPNGGAPDGGIGAGPTAGLSAALTAGSAARWMRSFRAVARSRPRGRPTGPRRRFRRFRRTRPTTSAHFRAATRARPWPAACPAISGSEPFRADPGAPSGRVPGLDAGGDGAAQPGREPGQTSNGGAGNGYPGSGYPGDGQPTNGHGGPGPGADGHPGNGTPTEDDGWSSWWTRSTPPPATEPGLASQPEPRPDPRPEPPSGAGEVPLPEPRLPADHGDGQQLRRRVPQANLAAGLRRDSGAQPEPDEAPVVRDPMAARTALSRFQAAQRAARGAVEGDGSEGGSR